MAMTGGTAKLVKTTYPFSDKSKAVNLYIYYKTSQDVANNRSTISCGMYVTTPSGWDIGQWDDFQAASYVGTTGNTFNGTVPNFSGTRWIAENKTFTVDHNADGTGKATIQWKWAVNSPWGGYVNPSGSFSIDLPQIPRATTPTLSASSVQMGKAITVTMSRASSSFTHTLKYTINGTTGTIASGLGTSYIWTIPKDLVQYIPNKLSSAVTITCETYSGGTKVGSKDVSFTATVPNASAPTVSASSVQMGKDVTITTNREVSQYTHKLEYTLNGTTGTIAEGVGASHKWTVPDLVALIPNATSGTATITCTTYNGTAKVGSKTVQTKITTYDATTPTISNAPQMGKPITIGTPRASTKYTHNLTYSIGSKTGTIATGIGSSCSWIIPTSLVSEIKNAVSGSMSITCTTMNGTATVGTKKISFVVKVPAASVPSVSSNGVMGEAIAINTNRAVSQYTHILKYTLGSKSGFVSQNTGDKVDWTIPLSLAAEIPTLTSGTITISCETWNGTALVGTNSCSFTVTVPDNADSKPVFSAELRPIHSFADEDGQFAGLYLVGKSQVGVTFDASSEYANIIGYKAKLGSTVKESASPNITLILPGSGTLSIELTVTDSRGYSRTATYNITGIPYDRPKLAAYSGENSIICTRSRSDGTIARNGEFVLVRASASFSEVVYHNKAYNKCRIWYRYKTASSSDYSMDWIQLYGTEISVITEAVFNIKTAYTFQLKVEDDVGEERVYTYPIAYFSVPVHMGEGGRNLGLGQFCDYSELDRIDVGWKTYFNIGIGRKVIFEADSTTSGWKPGEILSDVFTDADTTMVMNYTIFIAMVSESTGVGGKEYPVLCLRRDGDIYGFFGSVSVEMHYFSTQEAMKLTSITDGYNVTALYALL